MIVRTLLYVDDDLRHRDSLIAELKAMGGYHILAAATCDEALTLARQQPPDMALIDIQIPRSDPHSTSVNSRQRRHGIALGMMLSDLYPNLALLFYSNFDDCWKDVDHVRRKRRKQPSDDAAANRLNSPGTGYILKGANRVMITTALQHVSLGRNYLDPRIPSYQFRAVSQLFLETLEPELAEVIMDGYFTINGTAEDDPGLSRQEMRLLEQLGRNHDILKTAQALRISESTARNTAGRIYKKLFDDLDLPQSRHKASLAALVWTLYALEEGITSDFDRNAD